MKSIFTIFLTLFLTPVFGQYHIYNDAATIITGTWNDATSGSTTLNEVTNGNPYEGTRHYEFNYNYSEWWAGLGLNFDNWGSSAPLDLSGYSHLRIAYRGLSNSGESVVVQLAGTDGDMSNEVTVGEATTDYRVVDIPITALISGSTVNMNQITGMQFSMNGIFTATGTLYLDAIELLNIQSDASAASVETWTRAQSVRRGVNTANWLEAHWLIPYDDAFPETNKYNATNIQALVNAGFDVIRLPITFERFTPTTAPYTIPANHEVMHLIDNMIAWAEQYDFKLIIDNHHGYDITDNNYETELPRLKAIWQQLATRYGNLDPERYFFEVYNEAHLISNANLRPFYTEIIETIRTYETQTHSILIGASGYNSGYDLIAFTPLADSDIIYTFHSYEPYFFTHQGMSWTTPSYFASQNFPQADDIANINSLFSSVADWSSSWNVPVWLGEYGVSTAADAISRCSWIEALETATQSNSFVPFYWDAISDSDAFGFFTNGVVSEATTAPCFAEAMNLYETALSIQDIQFNVDCDNKEIYFALPATASEAYQLQSSIDGKNWRNETTFSTTNKRWKRFPIHSGANHYRLQSISDGRITYSTTISSPCPDTAMDWFIYPNPAKDAFRIEDLSIRTPFEVQLYDLTGKMVQQWKGCRNEQSLDLNSHSTGIYLIKINLENGQFFTQRLVID